MEKILIIGNSGCGKTTFARKLAQKLSLPLIHLDKLYWRDNWEHIPEQEFDLALQAELDKPQWIIDGNFNRTLPHRLKYCDTVFFLDYPVIVALGGITKRLFTNLGKSRDDMGGNCPERIDGQKYYFYKAVMTYNQRHREEYLQLFEQNSQVNVIAFKSRKQAEDYLNSL